MEQLRRSLILQKRSMFDLGMVVATPGAIACLEQHGVSAVALLMRHQSGDWREIPDDDRKENEKSVVAGLRILSSYPIGNGERIWVITEADRSVTTLLLPQEY